MGEKKVKEASDISSDIYLEDLDRWFDLHERTITWTDRTAVRLQILSDITERRKNENLLVEQQARSELNSRLVTMGEMASSLAHELNQPLTAISNYAFIVSSLMKRQACLKSMKCFIPSRVLRHKPKEPRRLFKEFVHLLNEVNRKWSLFLS